MNIKPFEIDFGLLLGAVGILLAIYFYFNPVSTSSRELFINLRSQSPILTDEASSGLKFTVNGIETNNVYLSEVILANSGTETIQKQDFFDSQPIKLYFGKDCEILNASDETNSKGFKNRLSYKALSKNSLIIQPTLLNSGDSTIIKVITAKCKPIFETTADISGIPNISQNWTIEGVAPSVIGVLIFVAVFMAVMYFSTSYVYEKYNAPKYIQILLMLGGIFILFLSIGHLLIPKQTLVNQIPIICKDIYERSGGGDF